MYSSGEVCKKLNVKFFKVDYLIRNGYVKAPKVIGSNRVFTDENVKEIKEELFKRI